MTSPPVTEQQVLEALRHLPPAQWPDVLEFMTTLGSSGGPASAAPPIRTAHDLAQSGVVGLWRDRDDIANSRQFARRLREQAERRSEAHHATGH